MIHPLAAINPEAVIAEEVEIGPFAVIESGVRIGRGCQIASHAVIRSGTSLGSGNQILEGAVLGGFPQHINMPEQPGRLEIGEGNVFRENVTVHRSLYTDGLTKLGDNCLLMVNSHIAHDCELEDGVILTNNVVLGGHVHIGAKAYLAGCAAVHQFCRVGRLAMVGGMARVRQDVPPFVTVDGGSTMVVGLNKVGMRRAGISRDEVSQIKAAYQVIYRTVLPWQQKLLELQKTFNTGPAAEFEPFFCQGDRGFVQERRAPPGATVRIHREEDVTKDRKKRKAG